MTTYYVSPTGDDNSTTGSESAPFKTIQKAANKVNPGDTVIVKNGTYTDENNDAYVLVVTRGGTKGNLGTNQYGNNVYDPATWVTFKSENLYGAILKGKIAQPWPAFPPLNWTLMGYVSTPYVRIEGFEMKDGYGGVSVVDTHDVIFYKNKIHDMKRDCFTNDHPNIGDGTSAFGGVRSQYITYDSNIVYRIGRLKCGYNYECTNDHTFYNQNSNVTIINNVIYENTAGWVLIAGGAGMISDWKIINNTMYMNNYDCSHADYDYAGTINPWGSTENILIQNNIIYVNGAYAIHNMWNAGGLKTVKNNLIYGVNGGWLFCTNKLDLYKYSGNRCSVSSDQSICDSSSPTDPKFVDLAGRNFHLQPKSPAIGKGLMTNAPLYDCDSNPRTGRNDIGAFQYTGTSTCSDLINKFAITKI